jgi:hypothetical protein
LGFFIYQQKEFSMKNTRKCTGIALIAAIGFAALSLIVCDNGTTDNNPDPGLEPSDPQSVTYVSKDNNGNLYTLVVTENTSQSARYAARNGDSFTFTVELFNSGNYTVALTYSGTIDSVGGDETAVELNITVNGRELTITIIGAEMTVISGEIVNNEGGTVVATPDTLTPFVDKRALETAITAANTAKAGVVVSVNGTDVLTTVYWVSEGRMDTFTSAIAFAQAVYDDEGSDQSMVNSEKIRLTAATTVFNGQKRFGTKSETPTESDYDVYVAGSYSNGTNSIPCYWKNDVRTDLPLTTGEIRGWAEKIIVVGSEIYIIGNVDNGTRSVGCYWKNGVISLLSNNGYANDMAILNGDIYIVGFYESEDNFFACYWKNSIKTDLPIPEGGKYGSASTISIYGNSVYIAGHYQPVGGSDYGLVCYWKDGVRTDFTVVDFNIRDMTVAGNDVFMVGEGSSYPRTPQLWKNGSYYTLSVPSGGDSMAYGVTLSNDNIFIVGFYENWSSIRQACYWKNAELTTLQGSTNGKDTFAHDVSIIDDDVFIAGSVNVSFELVGEIMTSTSTACYWRNGTLIELSSNASANDICVIVRQ